MKRFLILVALLFSLFAITGCKEDVNKNIDVLLYLQDFENVTTNEITTFELKNTIGVDTVFELSQIEILTSDYSVTPYESIIVDDSDYDDHIAFLIEYFDQITENHIVDSNIKITRLHAKVVYHLVNENSEIQISFYQNEVGEIISSEFHYTNNDGVDVFHNYDIEANLQYNNMNNILSK